MCRLCRSSKHAHTQLDISISPTHIQVPPHLSYTTALYTLFATSCARFSQAPPRPNLERSFTTATKRAHYVLPSMKWGILNLQHRWQPTTTPPAGIATYTVKQKRSKQLTCVFIGSAIAFTRDNSKSIGTKVRPIVPFISPNIIPRLIIKPFDPRTWIRLQTPHEITSIACPKASCRCQPRPTQQ